MRIFGLQITREKAGQPVPVAENRGGWIPIIRESFTGAWQRNITVDRNTILSYHAVYACVTLIPSDISKLRVKLMEQDGDGIWTELTRERQSPFKAVLKKPNSFQNRIQFWENWFLSKLIRGNAYVLIERDGRGVVVALYVLDPSRVKPMVTDDGQIFYQLSSDNIAGLQDDVLVPASEIIHDRFNCLFHPLIGTSPLFAAGVAAMQGLNIQNSSATFFGNRSMPSGVLVAPGNISNETADRLKDAWDTKFTGENAGKIAVLGDGLKYEKMTMSAEESQLIDQLKWTAEIVCSVFHVPPYKIGVGTMPTYNNIQALNVEYYSQCLQALIEAAELCLDEGLGLSEPKDGVVLGTEFDLDGLLRMDSITQITALKEAVGAAVMAPNEARKKLDMKPVKGGEAPLAQQQNYSLAALAKRDAKDDPFSTAPKPATPALPPPDAAAPDAADAGKLLEAALVKSWDRERLPDAA